MEKSNSFKRVVAGSLALLTVASSVPAEAGSVIGDFFSTALVANAENVAAPKNETVAITNLAISNTAGTAKVAVGDNAAVDATVNVVTDGTYSNIKTLTVTLPEGSTFTTTSGKAFVTVDGYTVIDDVADVDDDEDTVVYNATVQSASTLEVKVNEYTSLTANGVPEFDYDGEAHKMEFGKNIADEGALDGEAPKIVEIAVKTSATDYHKFTAEEIAENFDFACDTADTTALNFTHVNRSADGTVIPHVVTLTGKKAYAGLTTKAFIRINPLDVTSKATVTGNN